jgi:hypothetical protein
MPPATRDPNARPFFALLREVHAATRLSASVARVARRGHARRFVRGRCPTMRRFQSSLAEALVRRSIATRLRLPPGQAARLSRLLDHSPVPNGAEKNRHRWTQMNMPC